MCRPHFLSKTGESVSHSFLIHFSLALTLLDGGRVSCQTTETASTMAASQFVTSLTPACDPVAQECKDRITAQEREWEIVFRSSSHDEEITIQKLRKIAQNLSTPGVVNFYEGEASFGTKPRFHKRTKIVNWRPFLSGFDLRGFAEMCCVDPFEFNPTNYGLQYAGGKMLLGRLCLVYQVTLNKHGKGRHFTGTIWVLPDSLRIIRAEGAFHPMRKILWFFPVEDHWFNFDSWRKEISPGKWVPDFTCTGVAVAVSDFTNPAFRARIIFSYGTGNQPSRASEYACGMESFRFPTQTKLPQPKSRQIRKYS